MYNKIKYGPPIPALHMQFDAFLVMVNKLSLFNLIFLLK